jgi:hypothetical protein
MKMTVPPMARHILGYRSKHTMQPLGQWKAALFSVEAENEAWGHSPIKPAGEDWLCEMSGVVRSGVHPQVLVTTGGGGVGTDTGEAELRRARGLARCEGIDS